MDLFGNIIDTAETIEIKSAETPPSGGGAGKNIHNTPHDYTLVQSDEEIKNLVQYLSSFDEIRFDTETTGIDANNAEIVGMSFSVKAIS